MLQASASVSRALTRLAGVVAGGRDAGGRLGRRAGATLALGAAALLACALQGALLAAVAQAAAPKLVPYSFISLTEPVGGVAVDQPSGDLYVLNFSASIDEFNASGELLSPPSPFGEGVIHSSATVNPVNGDLYVLNDFPSAEIEMYEPDGVRVGTPFPVTPSKNFYFHLLTDVQIAADSAGDVYVPVAPENEVIEYAYNAGKAEWEALRTFTGGTGSGALSGPTGVAVDSSGDLWVADTGDNRIEELSPSDLPIGEIKSEGVEEGIALDGHGDVFAVVRNSADPCGSLKSPCSHLVEYNSAGVQTADVGASSFVSEFSGSTEEVFPLMVAVDEASGRVYVTGGEQTRVWVFQPPLAPVLGQESTAEVGTSEAKLGALVSPSGAQTTYRFEYDTREYREGEGSHGISVPFPEGSVGEGFSSRTVWASANGLAPGTIYHYRAIATNGVGTVVGPDRTFTTESVAQSVCPNEQSRGGFSAALPDCRAYELVTPPSKDTVEPDTGHTEHAIYAEGGIAGNYPANDGDRFAYVALEVMPGSQSAGLEFLATRGSSGWTTEDALPLQPYTGDRCTLKPESAVLRYSADLSKSVVVVNNYKAATAFTTGCRGEIVEVVGGEPLGAENFLLRDNSNGGSYQLINVTPPGVTPTEVSLVAASADLSLVVFSERAKLTPEALNNTVNLYEWSEGVVHFLKFELPSGTPVAGSLVGISADGSEVFFTAGGNLYMRLHDERTVQLDEPRGGSGPGGGGSLAGVIADGSQVFFSDDAAAGLTSDTIAGSGMNLYRYDMNTGHLSDLTPVSGADAAFKWIGEDGAYVYFDSPAVLTGSDANQFGETAQNGGENLYLEHGGTVTFVTHGGGVFSGDGAFLATSRQEGLYLYSAPSNRFVLAADVSLDTGFSGFTPHYLSNNGQVFFETGAALLPRDTNGQTDVYEFDYYSGLHLISTGTSSSQSLLIEASPSGNDVFFLTRQGLVPRDDIGESNKIYDARVDGGFPEPALPPACTTADACRSAPAPQPSIYGAPSSQTFSGAGNPAPPAEVKPKKKGKPKKRRARSGACRRSKHGRARCAGRAGGKAKAHHRGGK